MSVVGDWMRFSAWTWIVASQYNPTQIRDTLRVAMKPNDHFLILEVNVTGTDGIAQPWIWEWLRTRNR